MNNGNLNDTNLQLDSTEISLGLSVKKFKASHTTTDLNQQQTTSTLIMLSNDHNGSSCATQISTDIDNAFVSLSPPIKNPCVICKIVSKYTCPGCNLKTCSLTCVKEHKKKFDCTGIAKPTVYVKKSQLDENTILNDLKLISNVEHTLKDTHHLNNQENQPQTHLDTYKSKDNIKSYHNSQNKYGNKSGGVKKDEDELNVEKFIQFCQNKLKISIYSSIQGHSTYRLNRSYIHNINVPSKKPTKSGKHGQKDKSTTEPSASSTTLITPSLVVNHSIVISPTLQIHSSQPMQQEPKYALQNIPTPFRSLAMMSVSLLIPNLTQSSQLSSSQSTMNNSDTSQIFPSTCIDSIDIIDCIKNISKKTTTMQLDTPIPSFIPIFFMLYSLFSPLSFHFKTPNEILQEEESLIISQRNDPIQEISQQFSQNQHNQQIHPNHLYCSTCTQYSTPNFAAPSQQPRSTDFKYNKWSKDKPDDNKYLRVPPNSKYTSSQALASTSSSDAYDIFTTHAKQISCEPQSAVDTTSSPLNADSFSPSTSFKPTEQLPTEKELIPAQLIKPVLPRPSYVFTHHSNIPLAISNSPNLCNQDLPIYPYFQSFNQHISTTYPIRPYCTCPPISSPLSSSLMDDTTLPSTQLQQIQISPQTYINEAYDSTQYFDHHHSTQPLYFLSKLLSPANNPQYMDCPLTLSLSVCLSHQCNDFDFIVTPTNQTPTLSSPVIFDVPQFIVMTKTQRDKLYQAGHISLIAGMKTTSTPSSTEQIPQNTPSQDQIMSTVSQRSFPQQLHNISPTNPFSFTNNEENCHSILLDNDVRIQSLRHRYFDSSRPTAELIPSGELDDLNKHLNEIDNGLSDDDDDDSSNENSAQNGDSDSEHVKNQQTEGIWDDSFIALINKYRSHDE